jgi:hypothetical protein
MDKIISMSGELDNTTSDYSKDKEKMQWGWGIPKCYP